MYFEFFILFYLKLNVSLNYLKSKLHLAWHDIIYNTKPYGRLKPTTTNDTHFIIADLKAIITTNPPFTKPLLYSIMKEVITPKLSEKQEWSVDEFFRKRFGSEVSFMLLKFCIKIFFIRCLFEFKDLFSIFFQVPASKTFQFSLIHS